MARPRKAAAIPLPPEDADWAGKPDEYEDDPQPAAARRPVGRPKGSGNRGKIATRTASGRIQSRASLVAQVKAEVYLYLTVVAGAWSLRDPWCAASLTEERIDALAGGIVDMISRNEKALEFAGRSGIFGDIAKIGSAALPVGIAVWKAHGPGGHGHQLREEGAEDAHLYPAHQR